MHISIYNSIKVNFLDSKSVNTIQDAKRETTDKNTSSHPNMHIHEVFEDTRPPLRHLLPTNIRYGIITYINRTFNNARINLPKVSILKQYTT